MSIKDKIRQYVERRRMEAVTKQVSHKLIMIARNMGQEMVSTSYQPSPTPLHPDIDAGDEEGKILSVDDFDDWREYEMGFYFDGLRFGYNICIMCFAAERKVTQIRVTYNGYTVFAEVEGRLRAYAPFSTWEDAVNMLYDRALMADKRRREKDQVKQREEKEKKMSAAVYMLKRLWGY